jgi:uncharacterized membrane protein YhaH (DUF805 family)
MYWIGVVAVYSMFGLAMLAWSNFQPNYTASLIAGIWMLFWIIPLFALVAKRLHDLGFSAWWWIGANAALFVSILVRSAIAEQIMTVVLGGGLILVGCFRGVSGPNRFSDLSSITSMS